MLMKLKHGIDVLINGILKILCVRFTNHEVTAQKAANSYKKTKFSCTKGALAFFNNMQHHASHMLQPLDEYSMKRKFLEGLPEDLVENLL